MMLDLTTEGLITLHGTRWAAELIDSLRRDNERLRASAVRADVGADFVQVPRVPTEEMMRHFAGTPWEMLSRAKQRAELEAYDAMLQAASRVGANARADVGAEAELLAFAEKHRLAISPQVNGGWVIERTVWGIDDGDEKELARTRGTLIEALRMAQAAVSALY